MKSIISLVALIGVFSVAINADDECRRITAAFGAGDYKYLFFGNDYVSLDKHFKQNGKGNSYDLMQAPYPEAAFVWSVDGYYYVFSDKYYFSYWTHFGPVDAEIFGGPEHGEFFKDGLDAAGSLNGATLFFKGCQYVKSLPYHPSKPTDFPQDIPCNLDAAMTVGKDLFLFKGDKLWIEKPGGLAGGMPVDTSTVIQLDGITLCSA